MVPKPDFSIIVATTGQAAEHIAVACQYGAWKIAVMEQSPGVLRAVVGGNFFTSEGNVGNTIVQMMCR